MGRAWPGCLVYLSFKLVQFCDSVSLQSESSHFGVTLGRGTIYQDFLGLSASVGRLEVESIAVSESSQLPTGSALDFHEEGEVKLGRDIPQLPDHFSRGLLGIHLTQFPRGAVCFWGQECNRTLEHVARFCHQYDLQGSVAKECLRFELVRLFIWTAAPVSVNVNTCVY